MRKSLFLVILSVIIAGCAGKRPNIPCDITLKDSYEVEDILLHGHDFPQENFSGMICFQTDSTYGYIPLFKSRINGLVTVYTNKNVLIAASSYRDSKLNGPSRAYFKNGLLRSETNFLDNRKDGKDTEYFSNGNLKQEIVYKNGRKNGIAKFYYDTGMLQVETSFKNDKQNGVSRIYYADGSLKSESLIRDDVIERLRAYYPSGKLRGTVEKNGKAREYKENGALEQEFTTKNGKLDGESKLYNDFGRIYAILTYKENELVSAKCEHTGRIWTDEEITNWKNGQPVDCSY